MHDNDNFCLFVCQHGEKAFPLVDAAVLSLLLLLFDSKEFSSKGFRFVYTITMVHLKNETNVA